jgi:hypothetical protein
VGPCGDDVALGELCFVPLAPAAVGEQPLRIDAVDLDGDGAAEIGVADVGGGAVIFARVVDLALQLEAFATGGHPSDFVWRDLDGDGAPELVVPDYVACELYVFAKDGEGALAMVQGVFLGDAIQPGTLAADDLDDDGRIDFVVSAPQHVALVPGAPAPASPLGEPIQIEVAVANGLSTLALVDLDGDGARDAVVDGAAWLAGDGQGQLAGPASTGLGGGRAAVLDIDGDGVLDLAIAGSASDPDAVRIHRGLGGAAFAPVERIDVVGATDLAAADVDGDGVLELVVAAAGALVRVAAAAGARGDRIELGFDPFDLVAADLDGDGRVDLAALDIATRTVRAWLQRPSN